MEATQCMCSNIYPDNLLGHEMIKILFEDNCSQLVDVSIRCFLWTVVYKENLYFTIHDYRSNWELSPFTTS